MGRNPGAKGVAGSTLFGWFGSLFAGLKKPADLNHPAGILAAAGAPDRLVKIFSAVTDCEIAYKESGNGLVPDLEQREKQRKRRTGQFYTPQKLAERLFDMVQPAPSDEILDPACGDGSFLLAAAGFMQKTGSADRNFLAQLHGFDIDLQALLVCLGRLIYTFPNCGWPDLRHEDFLLSHKNNFYDLVIGNPPYRVNLDEEYKSQLASRFSTSEGEKDLYTFFIEAGISALKSGGNLVMLTSHTYLVNHQCRKIRELVFAQNRVEHLLMLPERFFIKAPGVMPVVTVLRKIDQVKNHKLLLKTGYSDHDGWEKSYSASAEDFIDGCGLRKAIVTPALKSVFASMASSGVTVGNLCRVGVGIQESQKREGTVSKYVSDQALTDRHKPVLRGRELAPFVINWEGKYIDHGPHLAFAGCAKTFSAPKVLYQNIRNERLKQRLVAAYDMRGFFPKNSLSYIVPTEVWSGPLLTAVLNSTLVNAWFSGMFHSFHVTVTQLRQVPLPITAEKSCLQKVVDLVDALHGFQTGSQHWKDTLAALDQAVCCCYLGVGDHSGLLAECDNFLDQAARL